MEYQLTPAVGDGCAPGHFPDAAVGAGADDLIWHPDDGLPARVLHAPSHHEWSSFRVVITQWHDGDTFHADLHLGYRGGQFPEKFRPAGYNARELDEPGGQEALAHVEQLLPAGTTVTVALYGTDKDGRLLCAVAMPDGSDLAKTLIATQWAARWNGRGPKPVPPWPRTITP